MASAHVNIQKLFLLFSILTAVNLQMLQKVCQNGEK